MGRDEIIEPADIFLGPYSPLIFTLRWKVTYDYIGMETSPSINARKDIEKKYRV